MYEIYAYAANREAAEKGTDACETNAMVCIYVGVPGIPGRRVEHTPNWF